METPTLDSLQLEMQVFAQAIREPGAMPYFYDNLPSEDVGLVHGNRGANQFYIALESFYDKTGLDPVEPIAFKAWIESESEIHDLLGGAEGVDYFFGELDKVKNLSTPEATTKILKLRADKRRQGEYAAELSKLLDKRDQTNADKTQIRLLTAQIQAIEDKTNVDPFAGLLTGKDFAEMADSIWDTPDFLPTPFPELNKLLGYDEYGGVVKGGVSAISAPSGKGKSTFTKMLANYWVAQGETVLVMNYEETKDHYTKMMASQVTGVNIYDARRFTEVEKKELSDRFREEMIEWDDRVMVHPSPPTSYYEDLEKFLYDLVKTGKRLDAVIIDTINSLFMKKSSGGARWNQYEEMMVRLEKLAKELGAAIIITAQENTNRMKENREAVKQSDMGGGITIVQKCVVVMHLVPVTIADTIDEDDLMEVQISKNRVAGVSGSQNPPKLRYNDESKSFEPYDLVSDEMYDGSERYVDLPGDSFTL